MPFFIYFLFLFFDGIPILHSYIPDYAMLKILKKISLKKTALNGG